MIYIINMGCGIMRESNSNNNTQIIQPNLEMISIIETDNQNSLSQLRSSITITDLETFSRSTTESEIAITKNATNINLLEKLNDSTQNFPEHKKKINMLL